MKKKRILFLIVCSSLFIFQSCSTTPTYPLTKKVSQVDLLYEVKIEDPYRWLEDFNSKETQAWVDDQNKLTKKYISKNKYRKKIKKDLEAIWTGESKSIPTIRGEKTFFYFNDGTWQQSKFMVQKCLACAAELLIDPNNFSNDGTVSLSSVSISPNGEYVAYSVSDGGSDWKTWKIIRVRDKKILKDEIQWTKFSSGSWESDNSGFYYQKYPKPKGDALSDINRAPQLFFHQIGTSQNEDKLIYERPDRPNWSWGIQVTEDGLHRLLSVGEGTDERNRLYIKTSNEDSFSPLIDKLEATYIFLGSKGSSLWFFTNKDSPNGKIVKLDVSQKQSFTWSDVIKESELPITGFSLINNKFVIEYLVDTQSRVDFFNLKGGFLSTLDLPKEGSISGFYGKMKDRFSYFSFTNYVTPTTIYKIDMNSLSYKEYWSEVLPKFKSIEFTTSIKFYESKDGTKIPLHISHKKDTKLNEDTPVLLYGYGGFNISILPSFSKTYLAWMNQGGVVAVANLRGGSEYGDTWHEGGMLLNKQNVFDDFAYAAKFLHANKLGSSGSTVIQGRSNGGLLVGATMLQNPELFAVTIPQVGVMDMLRFSKFTIGWAWESDYGSVDNREEFFNLLSYSPYHNIEAGVCYPPTLITTANRDDRVVPSHSFKFAARLQELQGCDNPVLLRVETRAGHGSGTPRNKRIDEIADIYGYALSVIKDR
ncbi:MAG: S9 family peptidase [Chloroflexi bacterium]|nr:S9 family peptidase [Chloroflexota bacterium]|tara:strand:+ start:6034 stop:8145 length:2112 start_codon:yes stop_codon:yes gene_type:complete